MQLAGQPKVAEFEELEYGSIFVTIFADRYALRAIKAFVLNENDERVDRLVTIGPFTDDDQGFPGVYSPQVCRGTTFDLTQIYRFSPSVDPHDILPELPLRRSCPGLSFLIEGRALLGVRLYNRGSWWDAAYLDIATGEITFNIDHDRVIASRRWSFVDREDDARVYFEYPTPAGAESHSA